jgi:hypothetical protein
MSQIRSELLNQAILRLASLPLAEQDRAAIEILADICPEEEWVLLVASEPYQRWLATQTADIGADTSKPAPKLGFSAGTTNA